MIATLIDKLKNNHLSQHKPIFHIIRKESKSTKDITMFNIATSLHRAEKHIQLHAVPINLNSLSLYFQGRTLRIKMKSLKNIIKLT